MRNLQYGIHTTGEVAKLLRAAPRTVNKWFDAKLLEGYRIPLSRDRRIPHESLIRFCLLHDMPLHGVLHAILLVSADVVLGERLRERFLPESGYVLHHAATIYLAGRIEERVGPRTVVLDFSLGRGPCQEIAQQLRADSTCAKTVLIGLIGEDDSNGQMLTEYGFDAVLQRPFNPAVLAERIGKLRRSKNGAPPPEDRPNTRPPRVRRPSSVTKERNTECPT